MHSNMRRLALLLGGLVLASSSLTADLREPSAEPLRRIESDDPDRHVPLWLSASGATQDGYIKWEEFSKGGRMVVQALVDMADRALNDKRIEVPEDGCTGWTHQRDRHDEYIPNKTLEELATHFGAMYRGRVTAKAEGFFDGLPGTLYELDVESATIPAPARVYFYFPIARIQAEGVVLCHQGKRFPDQPQAGRQVLLFVRSTETGSPRILYPQDTGSPLILSPQDEEIFFEREDDTISLPDHYGEPEEGLTIEDLEKRALQLVPSTSQHKPDSGAMR
jgi:hypothetical protein